MEAGKREMGMGGEIAVICVTVTHLVAVLAGNLLKYKSSPYGGEGVTFSWLLRPQTLHPRIVSQFVCTLEGRPPHCDFLEAWLHWALCQGGAGSSNPCWGPYSYSELEKKNSSAQTGSIQQLTVKEALPNGLMASEVWRWFSVSEIIGKCGITGIMFEDQSNISFFVCLGFFVCLLFKCFWTMSDQNGIWIFRKIY